MQSQEKQEDKKTGIDFRNIRPGNFTYNPAKCKDGSFNQLRFEIGDTFVDGEEACSLLSDEEYQAIIDHSPTWKAAKIEVLKQLLLMFAYEVDYTIDGLSVKLQDRYNRFKKLYDDLINEDALPEVSENAFGPNKKAPHYFYYGMLENPGKFQ